MEIAAVLIGAILLAGALFVTFAPIYRGGGAERGEELRYQADDLRNRLNRVLDSIVDLDFDFDTDKIDYDVYAQQRKMLIGRGVSILIRLDKIEAELFEADDDLETLVERRRKEVKKTDSAIEAAIARRREA
ncbi:MAG: hypothetical protein L0154_04150 [Chloroflexi bacterium]|nr:hypothetical protein [Chloroflexota bacterium]